MVNPSAARHLALVVGVLLCFFVYMGYHIKNRRAAEAGLEDYGSETAAVASRGRVAGPDNTPLMTVNEPAPSAPSARESVTVNMPSGLPLPIGEMPKPPAEAAGGQSSGPPSLAGGVLAQANATPPVRTSPPPSGSIEESSAGIITGLTADTTPPPPSQDDRPQTASPADMPPSLLPPPAGGVVSATGEELKIPTLVIPGTGSATVVSAPPAPARTALPPPPPPPQPRAESPAVVPPQPSPSGGMAGAAAPEALTSPPRQPGAADPGRPGETLRTYVIRPGDTLSRIASAELGSIALADNIYLMNRDVIFDPDQLMVGTRIKLPPRQGPDLGRTPAPPMQASQPPLSPAMAPRPPQPAGQAANLPQGARSYRVRPGDTLSSIALQFYGSSSGWHFLYESNRQTIPNPNQLSVGTELIVPPYGGRQ